jgi:trigger factor
MTQHTLHHHDDGTIELTVTIPWGEISKVYDQVIDNAVKTTELPGFRKGKAPKAMVEEKLDRTHLYEDVIRKLLPQVYNDLITKEKLKPIMSPKVELNEAKEDENWKLTIHTCERPKVTLGDYTKAVKELKNTKSKKIWLPGEEKKEKGDEKDTKPRLEEILKTVADTITIQIPRLLLEQEVNRLLSALIDQTKSLGLSVEQYLSATGKNSDQIRQEYEVQAKQTIALEFGLEELADKEGIVVSDDEIDGVIKSAKTPEEKTSLEGQRYYVATVLRRQKTIDFLSAI